jgi:hypothetical protein
MPYNTGHSFWITDTDESSDSLVDFADYGITVLPGGNWPLIPTPHTDTVNIPNMDGGYTYVGEALPGIFTLQLCADYVAGGYGSLLECLLAFADAMPTDQKFNIHLDAVPGYYWVGQRTSGISGVPVAGRAIAFDLLLSLDNPTPQQEGSV